MLPPRLPHERAFEAPQPFGGSIPVASARGSYRRRRCAEWISFRRAAAGRLYRIGHGFRRRRQRQPTGREHQFNVRLRQETLDFIYGQANERNIPIAQVIEEMAEALKRAQQR